MPDAPLDNPSNRPPSPPAPPAPTPEVENSWKGVFVGPNGIRAGWRLLIAFLIFAAIGKGLVFVFLRIPSLAGHLHPPAKGQPFSITPWGQIFSEGATVLVLLFTVWLMSLFEKKSFAEYGLPGRGAFGKRFWQGIAFGFASISVLMGGIAALNGFSIGTLALSGKEIAKYGILYGVGFILVGIFEEFSFRGYLQATLASGIGFWPAAVLLAILFGAAHQTNPGETIYGLITAGSYGLFAAFTLARTGNLWFAIGDHAAWDWGETYFYSTPDSGLLAKGHLFHSTFHGPGWLTGGTVGPEGSYLVAAVVILTFLVFHFLFPAGKSAS
jgi:uncharacterized protein